MLPSFNPELVFQELLENPRVNVFMAVPTIYAKLLEASEKLFRTDAEKSKVKQVLREKIRLMVSGSAALPQVR
jgi:malonyl-CoA/methylmalonyl-CoA synthetase